MHGKSWCSHVDLFQSRQEDGGDYLYLLERGDESSCMEVYCKHL